MADKKPSILEEVMAEIESVRQGVAENGQYVVKSMLKEELNSLLGDDNDEDEVKPEIAEAIGDDDEDEETPATELDPEINSDTEEEIPADDSVIDDMGDTELPSELPDETMDQEMPGEEMPAEPELSDDGEEEVEDLRGMSNDEVMSVFKKMGPEDQVIVVKDDETIHLKDGNAEYIIKPEMGGDDEGVAIDESESEEATETGESDDKVVYEFEVPDNKEGNEDDEKPQPIDEKVNALNEQLVKTRRKLVESVAKSKKLDDQVTKMKSVIADYKVNENEYKDAISQLKIQLNEVAVFTSNLTYAVKLMSEHSTTKAEKNQILKRFDKASNLNESRLTYESLVAEFSSTRNPAENTVQKIIEGVQLTSGASKLNEKPVYQNNEFARIKELITKTSK